MRRLAVVLLAFGLVLPAAPRANAAALGTAFTYQGTLHQSGSPLTGSVDLQFALYDALTAGNPVGVMQTVNGVNVANGVFTVTLDFGNVFDGAAVWLQISVKNAGGGAFTLLAPRQALTAAPYALYALGGPGGGGSLTLPFTGAFARQGSTADNDALAGLAPFAVTNSATTGVSHGLIGRSNSSWQNSAGVLGVGSAATGATSGVQGYATGSGSGTGVVGIGASNGAYFRGGDGVSSFFRTGVIGTAVESPFGSTTGVLGTVQAGTGVKGEAAGGTGVHGYASTGIGVLASSNSSYGLVAQSNSGTGVTASSGTDYAVRATTTSGAAAVFGQNQSGYGVQGFTDNSAGVQGNGGTNGRGVEGYANAQAGVFGISVTGRGVEGVASQPSGYGGYFYNTAGGTALFADGIAKVKTLQILGGADVAERFEVDGTPEPGTVLVIDGASPGRLRASGEAYSPRVAGVVSGANALAAGVVLSEDGRVEGTAPVALTGRVWVRCDAATSAIAVGDLLTTAARTGHAMKASDRSRAQGAILGKAMTALDSGTGMVLVLVSLQ